MKPGIKLNLMPGFMLVFALLAPGTCRADELVFAISTGSAMPMTEFTGYRLSGGLLRDFGDALATAVELAPRYLLVPRKRIDEALQTGKADIVCDLRPEWLDAKDYLWSSAIFTNNMIVATRVDTPPARSLQELRGARLGIILGYRYPEIDSAIGTNFARDEAPTDDANLTKLVLRRFDYLVTNSLHFDYARSVHPKREQLNAQTLKINSFDTFCAIRAGGKLSLGRLNRAVSGLHKTGAIGRMMARYRLPSP